jgi:hypothetical protein
MKKWFNYLYFKVFNPVSCSEEIPELTLDQKIVEFLIKEECYFKRMNGGHDLYRAPDYYSLDKLELNTVKMRAVKPSTLILGKFRQQLGNMYRFEYNGRENKKYAISLASKLQRKFGLIIHCVLVNEKTISV